MTQVWPNPDRLSEPSPPIGGIGNYWEGYIAVRGDNGTAWGIGKGNSALGPGDCLMIAKSSSSYEGKLHAMVRRERIVEGFPSGEVAAAIAPVVRNGLGVFPPDFTIADAILGGIGIMVRVTGGTFTEPGSPAFITDDVYIDRPSFYAVIMEDAGGGAFTLSLYRYVGGAQTLIGSARAFAPHLALLTAGFRLYLVARNANPTTSVTLEVWAAQFQATQTSPGATNRWNIGPTPQLLFSEVDSSGARLLVAGRAGFILDKENEIIFNTIQVRQLTSTTLLDIAVDSAVPPLSGTSYLRDEFTRSNLALGITTGIRSGWGGTGFDLRTDFGYDRHSALANGVQYTPYTGGDPDNIVNGFQGHHVTNGVGHVTMTQPASTFAQEQYLQSSRETPDPLDAAYQVDARFAVTNEAGLRAGLVLRFTQIGSQGFAIPGGANLFSGYQFDLNSEGLARIVRRRRPSDGGAQVLTELDLAGTTNWQVIKAQVYEEGGPDPVGQGPVILTMEVDGVPVPFTVPVDVVPGVTITNGVVRDASSTRFFGAPSVALYAAFPTTVVAETHTVDLRDFERLVPEAVVALADRASVVLASEAQGATGTLLLAPEWEVIRTHRPDVSEVQPEVGAPIRVRMTTKDRRVYEFNHGSLDESTSEWSDLITFHADHEGPEIPFTWDPPGEEPSGLWRFDPSLDLVWEVVSYNVYRVRFRLVEVFA